MTEVTKKSNPISKMISVVIIGIILIVGVVASIKNSFVDMTNYTIFLEAFVYFFGTFVFVVGAGRATKNVATLRYNKEGGEIVNNPPAPPTEGNK